MGFVAFLLIGLIVAIEIVPRFISSIPSNREACVRYSIYFSLGLLFLALGLFVIDVDWDDPDWDILFTAAGAIYLAFGIAVYFHNVYIRLCDINESIAKLNLSLGKADNEKAERVCPSCGTAWIGSSSICPNCGAGVGAPVRSVPLSASIITKSAPVPPKPQKSESGDVCPSCGQVTRKNGKFCQKCGAPFSQAAPAVSEDEDNWTPPIPDYED